uniref:clp protease proteolytic subunit n=1 Tax=Dicranostigma leptopodum TaxID=56851 RepID=UPI002114AB4B|nr:clp protease proteolytic subunit [Dicranostigma leptopodum]USN94279.1 clp protease proteolytic subunit [Dicranostigma leptopodum]
MPVGVPKAPFEIPGDEEATWVDLYNRLHRQRFLFLCQKVDCENSNSLIGLITFLSIEDPTQEQYLFISSPGGFVISGAGIFDAIRTATPDVTTIGLGEVASVASFILSGGTPTKRIALPYARVMMHQPASDFYDEEAGEHVMESDVLLRLRSAVTEAYALVTGQPIWVIHFDLNRDTFMTATEAQAHGIVDHVGEIPMNVDENSQVDVDENFQGL